MINKNKKENKISLKYTINNKDIHNSIKQYNELFKNKLFICSEKLIIVNDNIILIDKGKEIKSLVLLIKILLLEDLVK